LPFHRIVITPGEENRCDEAKDGAGATTFEMFFGIAQSWL